MTPQWSDILSTTILAAVAPANAAWLTGAASVALGVLLLAVVTCFAKLVIIAAAVRYGLGASRLPSGAVAVGFAALLSIVIMWPVWEKSAAAFDSPGNSTQTARWMGAAEPLSSFLKANSKASNIELFASVRGDIAGRAGAAPAVAPGVHGAFDGLTVNAPAFMLTELTEAFQSALLILIPFLVIDLFVTNIMLAMGASSLSPNSVSLPLKLLVFVLMDGWRLIIQGVVLGYSY